MLTPHNRLSGNLFVRACFWFSTAGLFLVFAGSLLAQDDPSTPTPSPSPTAKHPRHHTPTPAPADDGSSGDSEDGPGFDGVAYVDKGLGSLVNVEKVNNELSPNRLLTVYVDIRNKTHKQLELQVQTMYEDTSKNLVSSDDSWIDFPLKPRETQEYCSIALTQEARSYLVRIRLEPADTNTTSGPGNGEGIPVTTPTPVPTPINVSAPNLTPPPLAETPTPLPTPKPVVHHKPKLADPSTLP